MTKIFAPAVANFLAVAKTPAVGKPQPRTQLVRHYIETGDDRCPLAGLWTEIVLGEPTDECERTWPALRFLHPGQAFILA